VLLRATRNLERKKKKHVYGVFKDFRRREYEVQSLQMNALESFNFLVMSGLSLDDYSSARLIRRSFLLLHWNSKWSISVFTKAVSCAICYLTCIAAGTFTSWPAGSLHLAQTHSLHIPCYALCLTIHWPRICIVYVSGELYLLYIKWEPAVHCSCLDTILPFIM